MVKLALLWHMHQPYYEDLATGEHVLPWVRLHAIKDYWGMVALLDEFPEVRLTFNLVPSLLVQVEAFAEGRARDRHLAVGLEPADALGDDDRAFVVANGFHAPFAHMIAPHRRYAELHAMKAAGQPFSTGDLRDLQVWHKLAWMDPDLLGRDERLAGLTARGGGFTEGDKAALREVELEILGRVVPAYRTAAGRGQVEVSVSPFYHPILPLLCDTDVHLRAHPRAARPRTRFARPGDAREQVRRALAFGEAAFGVRPRGMWPSEGSVSDEVLAVLADEGVAWTATDEDILARSLGQPIGRDADGHVVEASLLYRPYRVGAAGPAVLFRDHALSDRVGFTYQGWEGGAAAADFVARVREAGRRFAEQTGGAVGTVTVILDGENAWEHYPGGGRPFLRALYSALAASPDIETVTMSQAAEGECAGALPAIFPGSWINADFWVWIGHRDDHRAWDQLSEARAAYDERASRVAPAAAARAFEELLVAEGSDWFWWYGDDHSSDHDRDFDELYRRHLRNVYLALGAPVPEALHLTNISTEPAGSVAPAVDVDLTGLTAPVVDGRDGSFLEWAGGVVAPRPGAGGAMHEVATLVGRVLVAAGPASLSFRIEGRELSRAVAEGRLTVSIVQPAPDGPRRIDLEPGWMAAGDTVEISVPVERLSEARGETSGCARLALQVRRLDGEVVESAPASGWWTIRTRRRWAV